MCESSLRVTTFFVLSPPAKKKPTTPHGGKRTIPFGLHFPCLGGVGGAREEIRAPRCFCLSELIECSEDKLGDIRYLAGGGWEVNLILHDDVSKVTLFTNAIVSEHSLGSKGMGGVHWSGRIDCSKI